MEDKKRTFHDLCQCKYLQRVNSISYIPPFTSLFYTDVLEVEISMNKTVVRCRCGHQVMAREVLRTDLYERASGRDYIYIKFRCTRCKRLGQTFIPEANFDWHSLESAPDEMTPQERDRALEAGPISAGELMAFHAALKNIASVGQLQSPDSPPKNQRSENNEKTGTPTTRFAHASPRRRKRNSDKRNSDKRNSDKRNSDKRNNDKRGNMERNDSARGDETDDEQNAANGSGDDCNAT